MSDIHQVYSKKSLLTYSLEKTKKEKNKEIKTKSIPIPVKNANSYSRIGINEVNEIDGINPKMTKQDRSYEDLRKIVSSDSNLPPSSFNPNTPPEHNMIYHHIYNNDNTYLNQYHNYGLNEEMVSSL